MERAIALIDFREDHGPGYDDHSDGVIFRYAMDGVMRMPGIPSHMVFDADEGIRRPVQERGTLLVELTDAADVMSLPGTDGLLGAP